MVCQLRIFLHGKPCGLYRAAYGADLGVDKARLPDVEVAAGVFRFRFLPGEGFCHRIFYGICDFPADFLGGFVKDFDGRNIVVAGNILALIFQIAKRTVVIKAIGKHRSALDTIACTIADRPIRREAYHLITDDANAFREGNGVIAPLKEDHIQFFGNAAHPVPAAARRRQGADSQAQNLAGRNLRVLRSYRFGGKETVRTLSIDFQGLPGHCRWIYVGNPRRPPIFPLRPNQGKTSNAGFSGSSALPVWRSTVPQRLWFPVLPSQRSQRFGIPSRREPPCCSDPCHRSNGTACPCGKVPIPIPHKSVSNPDSRRWNCLCPD